MVDEQNRLTSGISPTDARGGNSNNDDMLRQKIFIGVGIVAALLIAALLFFASRSHSNSDVAPVLANALRPGNPEFERYRESLLLDSVEATESPRALGDIVMNLKSTARNFTDRTVSGLEVRASVVDSQGTPIKQRTEIIIPRRQSELERSKTLPINLMLEGIPKNADRANVRMEITGVTFK